MDVCEDVERHLEAEHALARRAHALVVEARRLRDGHAQAQRRIHLRSTASSRSATAALRCSIWGRPLRRQHAEVELRLDVELLAARAELAVRWGCVHCLFVFCRRAR